MSIQTHNSISLSPTLLIKVQQIFINAFALIKIANIRKILIEKMTIKFKSKISTGVCIKRKTYWLFLFKVLILII